VIAVADKKCGLCDHYKVELTAGDRCKLHHKIIHSLDKGCGDYINTPLEEHFKHVYSVKEEVSEIGGCNA
jgi:hypothetical protein